MFRHGELDKSPQAKKKSQSFILNEVYINKISKMDPQVTHRRAPRERETTLGEVGKAADEISIRGRPVMETLQRKARWLSG